MHKNFILVIWNENERINFLNLLIDWRSKNDLNGLPIGCKENRIVEIRFKKSRFFWSTDT